MIIYHSSDHQTRCIDLPRLKVDVDEVIPYDRSLESGTKVGQKNRQSARAGIATQWHPEELVDGGIWIGHDWKPCIRDWTRRRLNRQPIFPDEKE